LTQGRVSPPATSLSAAVSDSPSFLCSNSRRGSASEDPRRSPRPRSLSTGSNLEDLHGEFFAGTRKAATGAIEKLADFLGTKVVFWDLRARFIDSLYRTNASDCRMERMVVELDAVLSELCEVGRGLQGFRVLQGGKWFG
jgi:hypothetical protein